jgi:hypothetical protein
MTQKSDYLNFLPGFMMGITRSVVSHPFEIMKIRSQLGYNQKRSLLHGIHYSIIFNGLERGCQFFLYDLFRGKNESNVVASLKASFLTTAFSLPYNYLLINRSVIGKKTITTPNLGLTYGLEYSRAFLGSTIFLSVYNHYRDAMLPLWLSAFIATTVVWLITFPIDNVRNHLITNTAINYRRIYRGIQYPILRSLPSSLAGMYVYEKTKSYIT